MKYENKELVDSLCNSIEEYNDILNTINSPDIEVRVIVGNKCPIFTCLQEKDVEFFSETDNYINMLRVNINDKLRNLHEQLEKL